jgi:uncharacterized membrane protein YjfL (UPF0719 family)
MNWDGLLSNFTHILAYLGTYALLFLLAKKLNDILTPYKLVKELAHNDNPALGVSFAGYLLATAFIFLGILSGPSSGTFEEWTIVVGYSLLGLLMLNLSRWSLGKLVLNNFCNMTAIIEQRNMSMAAVRFGHYIATGLIVAGSLHGEGGGVETAVAFFLLGQISLSLFAWVYDRLTPFDLHKEIESGNVAAGVAFSGSLIALGIILGKAVSGHFSGWQSDLLFFVEAAIGGVVLLQIARMIMDRLVLIGHDLDHEIANDKNLAAGFLEMAVSVSFALVLAALF